MSGKVISLTERRLALKQPIEIEAFPLRVLEYSDDFPPLVQVRYEQSLMLVRRKTTLKYLIFKDNLNKIGWMLPACRQLLRLAPYFIDGKPVTIRYRGKFENNHHFALKLSTGAAYDTAHGLTKRRPKKKTGRSKVNH